MIKLRWPPIPSPSWLRNPLGGCHIGYVVDDCTVEANGSEIVLIDGILPSAGSKLAIVPRRDFIHAEPYAAYQLREAHAHKAREEQLEIAKNRAIRERQERLLNREAIAETESLDFEGLLPIVCW